MNYFLFLKFHLYTNVRQTGSEYTAVAVTHLIRKEYFIYQYIYITSGGAMAQ